MLAASGTVLGGNRISTQLHFLKSPLRGYENKTRNLCFEITNDIRRVVTVSWNSGQLSKRFDCVDKFEVILVIERKRPNA